VNKQAKQEKETIVLPEFAGCDLTIGAVPLLRHDLYKRNSLKRIQHKK
jgi:hypothetical protein